MEFVVCTRINIGWKLFDKPNKHLDRKGLLSELLQWVDFHNRLPFQTIGKNLVCILFSLLAHFFFSSNCQDSLAFNQTVKLQNSAIYDFKICLHLIHLNREKLWLNML